MCFISGISPVSELSSDATRPDLSDRNQDQILPPPDRNSGLSTGLVSRLLTSLELTARIGGGLGLGFRIRGLKLVRWDFEGQVGALSRDAGGRWRGRVWQQQCGLLLLTTSTRDVGLETDLVSRPNAAARSRGRNVGLDFDLKANVSVSVRVVHGLG